METCPKCKGNLFKTVLLKKPDGDYNKEYMCISCGYRFIKELDNKERQEFNS